MTGRNHPPTPATGSSGTSEHRLQQHPGHDDPSRSPPSDADDVERHPRPRCRAEPGSPCRLAFRRSRRHLPHRPLHQGAPARQAPVRAHSCRPRACLDHLRPGDTLVVPSPDRLDRSIKDLIPIVAGLRQPGWCPLPAAAVSRRLHATMTQRAGAGTAIVADGRPTHQGHSRPPSSIPAPPPGPGVKFTSPRGHGLIHRHAFSERGG
ncbi:recombinase family protein [Streptomyces sp. NPDC004059]